jgi:hypothetical protein
MSLLQYHSSSKIKVKVGLQEYDAVLTGNWLLTCWRILLPSSSELSKKFKQCGCNGCRLGRWLKQANWRCSVVEWVGNGMGMECENGKVGARSKWVEWGGKGSSVCWSLKGLWLWSCVSVWGVFFVDLTDTCHSLLEGTKKSVSCIGLQ